MSTDTALMLAEAPHTRPSAAAAKHIHARVGAAIRRRRRAIDITLQQLSQACGVSFQQVQKYESGASAVSAATLWNLACALQAPIPSFSDTNPTPEPYPVPAPPGPPP